jgi:hypothetical protein
MFSSGNIFKSFAEQVNFSFACDYLFMDNTSGISSIGVSGDDSSLLLFSFISGRIFDCNNRFIRSYSPFEKLKLSGNFCSGEFGYYVNDIPICLNSSVASASSSFDGFVFSTSGCSMEFGMDVFGESVPSYKLEFGDNIEAGNEITGFLKNTSENEFQSFKILSSSSFFPTYNYSISSDMEGVKIKPGEFKPVILTFTDRGEFSQYRNAAGLFFLRGDLTFDTTFGEIYIPVDLTLKPSLSSYLNEIS